MSHEIFTAADRAQIELHGLTEQEACRQLDLMRDPPGFLSLERPCTIGDGIETVAAGETADLVKASVEAALAGRALKFVPASGAASRMFKDLLRYRSEGSTLTRARLERDRDSGIEEAAAVLAFVDSIERFAFAGDLATLLACGEDRLSSLVAGGEVGRILDALLGDRGLGYATLSKGLVGFHRTHEGARTPLEEHLVEAVELVADAHGVCRIHFTVSPEHAERFRELLESAREGYERRLGVRFEVSLSTQAPATDTLAADLDGRPFRSADGRLLFRPSGHGALLPNLAALDADLVLVKNIDNVAPDWLKPATVLWKRVLAGLLVRLQSQIHRRLERLRSDAAFEHGALADPCEEAIEFARRRLHREPPTGSESFGPAGRRRTAIAMLDRPLRICGMVRNAGEPGGGPFWVRGADGATLQIVESAEVDPASLAQQKLLAASTHFNPVFMVLALKDERGRSYDLEPYVDPGAVIVTRKTHEGRDLLALERPGLWNGAMAGWNTLFVEVPDEVFTPVKTVLDLLRREHQPS